MTIIIAPQESAGHLALRHRSKPSVDSGRAHGSLEGSSFGIAADCGRITGNPEVVSSPVGVVPPNALVLSGLASFRVVGQPEVIQYAAVSGDQFPDCS